MIYINVLTDKEHKTLPQAFHGLGAAKQALQAFQLGNKGAVAYISKKPIK